ncbi:MAG TPA: hypothetical protein VMX57_01475 [Planctomycetota bacterium]|nr:hypothetical protein [Planctomycetota bacterium]
MIAAWSTTLWLAQTGERTGEQKLREAAPALLILFGVLVAAVIIGCIVTYFIRSRALRSETTGTGVPLTLSEIRRMHREGEIDDLECQRLKDIVKQQVRGETSMPTQAESPPSAGPTAETPPGPTPPTTTDTDTEE